MIIIGSTGEVYPAATLPAIAKENGARIIEINPLPTAFTAGITDLHIEANAVAACLALRQALQLPRGFPGIQSMVDGDG
jgi:NAD-dependent deacetylase